MFCNTHPEGAEDSVLTLSSAQEDNRESSESEYANQEQPDADEAEKKCKQGLCMTEWKPGKSQG